MDNGKILTKLIACGIVNSVFRDWVYIGIQTCKAKSALQVFFTPHLLHEISGLPYSEYAEFLGPEKPEEDTAAWFARRPISCRKTPYHSARYDAQVRKPSGSTTM